MQNTPRIETERLILRRFELRDLEAVYRIYSDPMVLTFVPVLPLADLEAAKAFLQKEYLSAYEFERGYKYAICLKEDDIPIGYVHVSVDKSHDFGYGLLEEFRHRGIMTEAGRALIRQVKQDGVPYITATHDVKNPASGAVMKRLGMKYRYSYKEQWQPRNILVTFRMYQLNLDGTDDRVFWDYWNRFEDHFVEEGL